MSRTWSVSLIIRKDDKPAVKLTKDKAPEDIRYEKRGDKIYRTYVKNRIKQIQEIIDAEEAFHDEDLESEVLMLKRLLKKLTVKGDE